MMVLKILDYWNPAFTDLPDCTKDILQWIQNTYYVHIFILFLTKFQLSQCNERCRLESRAKSSNRPTKSVVLSPRNELPLKHVQQTIALQHYRCHGNTSLFTFITVALNSIQNMQVYSSNRVDYGAVAAPLTPLLPVSEKLFFLSLDCRKDVQSFTYYSLPPTAPQRPIWTALSAHHR